MIPKTILAALFDVRPALQVMKQIARDNITQPVGAAVAKDFLLLEMAIDEAKAAEAADELSATVDRKAGHFRVASTAEAELWEYQPGREFPAWFPAKVRDIPEAPKLPDGPLGKFLASTLPAPPPPLGPGSICVEWFSPCSQNGEEGHKDHDARHMNTLDPGDFVMIWDDDPSTIAILTADNTEKLISEREFRVIPRPR